MMQFLLLFSRQGKLRLQKWFTPITDREKKKVIRDMMMLVLARPPRSCNFLQWRDLKIVYKRYASLYFCAGLDDCDNELLTLEVLHRYVELLDKYFGNLSLHPNAACFELYWRARGAKYIPPLPDQKHLIVTVLYASLAPPGGHKVCELDIIFNFEKAYFILDEFLMGGEVQETSKVAVGVSMEEADTLQETMEEYMSKPAY